MKRRAGSLMILAAVVAACRDFQAPMVSSGRPVFEILDGAHSNGNPHFFFLPPMVPQPSFGGAFDGSQAPLVSICEWTGTQCVAPLLAEFSTTTGPGSETVRVVPADQLYIVNWHTDQFNLDAAKMYRIRVTIGAIELGHADVDVVNGGKELKNVNTGEYIPLLNGRTLPIKFRIELGALPQNFWGLTNFALLPGVGVSPHLDPGIAVGPGDVLFVGVSCYPYDPNCQGIFRSMDHGATWTQQNSGLSVTNVGAISVTPAGHLVAGTYGGGVFRSVDGGDSWQQTGLTIPHVTSVFSTRDAVYALDGFSCFGAFRSDDDGASWTPINNGLATCDNAFAAAPTGDTLYIGTGTSGVFRSTDRGASWIVVNSGLTNINVSGMALNSKGDVFAATGGGLLRSTDKASSWSPVNSGLPNGGIDPALRIGINRSDQLFASLSAFGVYRSADNGTSWQGVESGLTVPPNWFGGVVFESTGFAVVSNGLSVWRSTRSTTNP